MTSLPPTHGFEFTHRTDAWGTHQPVLCEAVLRTNGPILELGSGYNSTRLIHHFTKGSGRQILTVDHDATWLSKFLDLESPTHQFKILSSWDEITEFKGPYSVVFVDEGLWESRVTSLKHFADKAMYVVLHDSDYIQNQLQFNFADHYKYFKTFIPIEPHPYVTGPPTTILSNVIDVGEWEIDYAEY